MSLALVLLQLSVMHILMAMIPGPNTVVVTYFSARMSRQAGLKAVAGIVLGSAIWVILSMLGVGVLLLEAAPSIVRCCCAGPPISSLSA